MCSRAVCRLLFLILSGLCLARAATAIPTPEPVTSPHFPDRLHAFVWRNWQLVPARRMGEVVGASVRDITLPAGMENWYMPDFDDSKWTEGKAPIGKGVWKHSGITLDKFPSTWGEGEFLLMRTTFETDDLNCESYRIAILARSTPAG